MPCEWTEAGQFDEMQEAEVVVVDAVVAKTVAAIHDSTSELKHCQELASSALGN